MSLIFVKGARKSWKIKEFFIVFLEVRAGIEKL